MHSGSEASQFDAKKQVSDCESIKGKIFRILILASFSVLLLKVAGETVAKYFRHETVTSISVSKSLKNMTLPEVLVCHDRPMNRHFSKLRNMSEPLVKYVLQAFERPSSLEVDDDLELEYWELLKGFPGGIRQLFFEAGPDCSSLVTGCTASGKKLNCCNIAKTVFDRNRGKCFLFKDLPKQK